MTLKHTPGPWYADIRSGCAAVRSIPPKDAQLPGLGDNYEGVLAYCGTRSYFDGMYWRLEDTVAGDITLMAAAPTLLDALRDLVAAVEAAVAAGVDLAGHIDLDKARAAIAKAEGFNCLPNTCA